MSPQLLISIILIYLSVFFSIKKVLFAFFLLMPFYYLPFIFISNPHDDQWYLLRAFKDYVVVAILLAWITQVLVRKTFAIRNKKLVFFVFTLVGIGVIKIIFIDELWLNIARSFIFYPLWCVLIQDVFDDVFELIKIGVMFIYSSLLVSVIGIFEYLFLTSETIYSLAAGQHRIISTMFNPNALGWYLAGINSLVVTFCFLKYGRLLSSNFKCYAFIIFLVNTVAILLSGSRSSLIGNFVVVLFFFHLILRSSKILVIFFIFSLTLPVFFHLSMFDDNSLRAFDNIEDSRLDIYLSGSEVLFNSVWDMLFGAARDQLLVAHGQNLLNDSFILWMTSVAGIYPILIMLCIGLIVVGKVLSGVGRKVDVQLCFGFASLIFLIFGSIGNVQMIFPHGIIFWTILALGFSKITNFKIQ